MKTATYDETTARGNFSKVVRVGIGEFGSVFCKISFAGGKLSISGVEGPKKNGDCRGSCGQIDMHKWHINTYAPGWTPELEKQFRDVWHKWHLNDMRAGCEHQRAEHWGEKDLEIVTYKLTQEGYDLYKEASAEAGLAAQQGRIAKLSEAQKLLLDCWYKKRYSAPDADSPLSGLYEVDTRETERANWVNQDEHPEGVLSKPCPVCGYKYGSQWLREEVPQDVLDFLRGLPDTDIQPAWV